MTKPRYADLNEDEQQLFRAAYDTPSYDQDDFEDVEDMHSGQLDLLKDALWAVKAKLKELKAFNKALAANLLSTQLKVKELLAYQMSLKTHHHDVPDKRNAIHNYQVCKLIDIYFFSASRCIPHVAG